MARVRRFHPRDADAVISLWSRSFAADPERNQPEHMLERKLRRDMDLIWVATEADDVVGAAMAGYDGVRGWLYHVAVDPEHRRQGVGTALVERAVAELEVLGCPKVNLQVRTSNAEVLAFYAALSFTTDDVTSLGRVLG